MNSGDDELKEGEPLISRVEVLVLDGNNFSEAGTSTLTQAMADRPEQAQQAARLRQKSEDRWDLQAFDQAVRHSQARRLLVYDALRNGAYFPWDYQPIQQASERYMRNHLDLNSLEDSKRYPRGE